MSLWEKMQNEDGEGFLKKLEEMSEKNNGAFNIAKVLSEEYGLSDEEVQELNRELVERLDESSLLDFVRSMHEAMGVRPTIASVLTLIPVVDALLTLKNENEELRKNDKIQEIVEMAKGRLLLVREELDNADIYIVHVPRKNPFEEMLKNVMMVGAIGKVGGGGE